MKKLLMLIACASAAFFAAFAGEDEVTVKVSVAGTVNNSALKKQCEVKGKKEAVKKYLLKQNSNMEEKVIADAMASYAKFVEGIEADEQEYEDGELTCSFTVTIKQEELAQWLKGEGVDLNAAADGSSLEIFVMEEPPDAGQMVLGDDVGNFFFTRYNMFQRRIRDALVKKVGEFGFKVILLEDNENYEEMKKKDPVLVGVSYDVKLYKGLYFIPEIDFILKGFDTKHSFTLARISYSTPIHMTYLQAPIMVAYKFTMKEKGNIVLKVGPYFACGLFGSKASISGWGYNKEVDVFDSVYGFRRFDAGINAGLAFERNHLAVGFEYSRGLYKLYPDLSQYNQSFGITLGFRI